MQRGFWFRFSKGFRARLSGSVSAAVVSIVGLDDAEACSPPPTGFNFIIPWSFEPIPRDGVVFIENSCLPSSCYPLSEATFAVFDETGAAIAGAVEETPASPSLLLWRASELFAPGKYTLEGRHPEYDGALTQSFEVRDALDVPVLDPTRSATSWEELVASEVCCQEGNRNTCGNTSCYPLVEGVTPRISVGLDFAHSDEVAPQAYLYRARAKGAEWPSFAWWHQVGPLFEELADEYCYEVQVQSLHAGGELWEAEGCIPASEVPSIIKADLAEIERTLFMDCTVPPAGHEARWCETFEENIATGSCDEHVRESSCEAALVDLPDTG